MKTLRQLIYLVSGLKERIKVKHKLMSDKDAEKLYYDMLDMLGDMK